MEDRRRWQRDRTLRDVNEILDPDLREMNFGRPTGESRVIAKKPEEE